MNTQVSSEMFVSLFNILHERLPCSSYFYRQRALFKNQQIQKHHRSIAENSAYDHDPEQKAQVYARAE